MSFDYRSVMSGQRRDPLAMAIRGGLWLGTIPYRMAVTQRNRRYDRGTSEVLSCGVPVISVGNLTTGGTGKTPIVCMLAKWLRAEGLRVAIVSRGYGRGDQDSNDEAMELHARLPDVPHVQNPDRVAAAEVAVDELESQVILMDDGFQHRRLHRDLNIVVIDALCPFGHGYLLPRGLLREPIAGLARADLVMISRASSVQKDDVMAIKHQVKLVNREAPIVCCDHQPRALLEHPDRETPISDLAGQSVAVVSAIGNPQAFEQTVTGCGARVVATRVLPDHDPYARETVADLRQWIESLENNISCVVVTHKDLVKLKTDRLGGCAVAAILIELAITENMEAVESALKRIAEQARGELPT